MLVFERKFLELKSQRAFVANARSKVENVAGHRSEELKYSIDISKDDNDTVELAIVLQMSMVLVVATFRRKKEMVMHRARKSNQCQYQEKKRLSLHIPARSQEWNQSQHAMVKIIDEGLVE